MEDESKTEKPKKTTKTLNRLTNIGESTSIAADDGRLHVPKTFVNAMGLSSGDQLFVIEKDSVMWLSPWLLENSKSLKIDEYDNAKIALGESKAGVQYKFEIVDDNQVTVTPTKIQKWFPKLTHQGQKPYLKWAGGKYKLSAVINSVLPQANRLIEPFIGAGSVFLNTDFDNYLLSDINPDLINLHNQVKERGAEFVEETKLLFIPENNSAERFYELRTEFNNCTDIRRRSSLFIYLNRHCYNGLCRYNSKGGFNVPFGKYQTVYFPEEEMIAFHEKAQKAQFIVAPFQETMKNAKSGDVVYCDPPYVPTSDVNFTYTGSEFGMNLQQELTTEAEEAAKRGAVVAISNHSCDATMKMYDKADRILIFEVRRNISCAEREKANELIAVYQGI